MLHRLEVVPLGRTYLAVSTTFPSESFLETAHLGPFYSRHTYLLPVSLSTKEPDHDSRSERSVVVFGWMVSPHAIKPPLTLQSVIDDRPGALASVTNLAIPRSFPAGLSRVLCGTFTGQIPRAAGRALPHACRFRNSARLAPPFP